MMTDLAQLHTITCGIKQKMPIEACGIKIEGNHVEESNPKCQPSDENLQ